MTDTIGMYDFLATHALIPDATARDLKRYCDFLPDASGSEQSPECKAASDEAGLDVVDVDIYNIYAPLCHDTNLTSKPRKASVSSIIFIILFTIYIYTTDNLLLLLTVNFPSVKINK